MAAADSSLYSPFDTGTEEVDVGNLHDMPWSELNRLLDMFSRASSTQPPAERSKSPSKNSLLQSSPSPSSGHAQFTPSSTNPDLSNESSFEVDDGSYGASSVYTTSPVEDYVHVPSFSSCAAGPSTTNQTPHSASGDTSSLAYRPRDVPNLFTPAPYPQWTSMAVGATMDQQNTRQHQPSFDSSFDESSIIPQNDLVGNMPVTGPFGSPFRPAYTNNAVPNIHTHLPQQAYRAYPQQSQPSWGLLPMHAEYPGYQQPLMDFELYNVPQTELQMPYQDQAAMQYAQQQAMLQHVNMQRLRYAQLSEVVYPQPVATQRPVPSTSTVTTTAEPEVLHAHHHRHRESTPASTRAVAGSSHRHARDIFSAAPKADSVANKKRVAKKDKPRVGGRPSGTHLQPHIRQKSSAMRKTGACWRCAMQRDQCDGNDPCSRCEMRVQKGQQYFFACDRSKLPDFVLDFLPPSMTLMHQKQTIEDCVQEQVRGWDFARPVDVYLTSGYGHALRWTLYEFEPTSDELLNQFQYFQDPATGLTRRYTKYSPPLGITKLDPSDDTHFSDYLDGLMAEEYLKEFGWICFEEENRVSEFQAVMLAMLCRLAAQPDIDYDLRELLRKIIRMMIITYIMGHTLTISEDTLPSVVNTLKHSQKPSRLARHTSPRLANRQLKFFFHVLRGAIYEEILKWLQATLHTSGSKDVTWLPAFCVMLGFGMVLEEVQRTIQIQADSKAQKGERTEDEARQEALNACGRIDERYTFLIGLFQCKYRDRKWTSRGSFGNSTPELKDHAEREFLKDLYELLAEQKYHLRSRENVTFSSENQCKYTSRLVARFLLPFLGLPAQ